VVGNFGKDWTSMKKLALVTLLAVAASWLLSETGPPAPPPTPPQAELGQANIIYRSVKPSALPEPPSPPESPRVVVAPVPPSPPRVIRTTPRRKADPARSRLASATSPATTTAPSWFPESEIDEEARSRPDASGVRVLVGRVSVSEDRARQDLRKTLEREVSEWVAADVPPTWKVPAPLIVRMIRGSYVQKVTRNLRPATGEPAPAPGPEAESPSALDVPGLDHLYILYRAGQQVEFSPQRKARIIEAYRKDLATQRMQRMGGGLALALGLLAVMSGYIRADEATRGYYTNRLRLAAVAGLGVAGVAAYRFLG
jgi:hypothetical protein